MSSDNSSEMDVDDQIPPDKPVPITIPCCNTYSKTATILLNSFPKTRDAEAQLFKLRCHSRARLVSIPTLDSNYFIRQSGYLVAAEQIPAGRVIIELNGHVALQNEVTRATGGAGEHGIFVYNGLLNTTESRENGKDNNSKLIIINTRKQAGNSENAVKFTRRSCCSNTIIKHVVGEFEPFGLLIVSIRQILVGEEILLPFDPDWIESPRPLQCVTHLLNIEECRLEKSRRREHLERLKIKAAAPRGNSFWKEELKRVKEIWKRRGDEEEEGTSSPIPTDSSSIYTTPMEFATPKPRRRSSATSSAFMTPSGATSSKMRYVSQTSPLPPLKAQPQPTPMSSSTFKPTLVVFPVRKLPPAAASHPLPSSPKRVYQKYQQVHQWAFPIPPPPNKFSSAALQFLRSLPRAAGDNTNARHQQKASRIQILNPSSPSCSHILVTNAPLQPGDAILEMRGLISMANETKRAPGNGVFGYTGLNQIMICIDTNKHDNVSRVIRRTCTPNATLKHIMNKREHLVILLVATKYLSRDQEVTLPFETDWMESDEPVECAFHTKNIHLCPFENDRKEYMAELRGKRHVDNATSLDKSAENAPGATNISITPSGATSLVPTTNPLGYPKFTLPPPQRVLKTVSLPADRDLMSSGALEPAESSGAMKPPGVQRSYTASSSATFSIEIESSGPIVLESARRQLPNYNQPSTSSNTTKFYPYSEDDDEEIHVDSSSDDDESSNWQMRCHCEMTHENGDTVECDACKTWQHMACMGITMKSDTTRYLCEMCNPRRLSISKVEAKRRQMKILEKYSKDTPKRKFKYSKSSMFAPSKAKGHSDLVEPLLANLVPTPGADRFLEQMRSYRKARKMNNFEAVMTTEEIPENQVVMEMSGYISLPNEVKRKTGGGNGVFMYTGLEQPICITTRKTGLPSIIRRSCEPNCCLKHMVDAERNLRVIVVATSDVARNAEITLPFDPDWRYSKIPLKCSIHLNNLGQCPLKKERRKASAERTRFYFGEEDAKRMARKRAERMKIAKEGVKKRKIQVEEPIPNADSIPLAPHPPGHHIQQLNEYSDSVDTILRSLPPMEGSDALLLQSRRSQKARRVKLDNSQNALMTDRLVAPRQVIMEMTGYVALPSECDTKKEPGMFIYDGLTKGVDGNVVGDHNYSSNYLCINTMTSNGNDTRFTRRSCNPNSVLKHVVGSNGTLAILLMASKYIQKDTEVRLPFDPNWTESEVPLKCVTHFSNLNDCLMEKRRQRLALERKKHVETERDKENTPENKEQVGRDSATSSSAPIPAASRTILRVDRGEWEDVEVSTIPRDNHLPIASHPPAYFVPTTQGAPSTSTSFATHRPPPPPPPPLPSPQNPAARGPYWYRMSLMDRIHAVFRSGQQRNPAETRLPRNKPYRR